MLPLGIVWLCQIAATQTCYGTAYFLFEVGTVQYECYEKNDMKCSFFLRMYSIVNGCV